MWTPEQISAFAMPIAVILSAWINNRLSAGRQQATMSKVQEAVAGVVETRATIATLEKNTNSIKDDLVKVTGEAAFAKGLKQGENNAAVADASAIVAADKASSKGKVKG